MKKKLKKIYVYGDRTANAEKNRIRARNYSSSERGKKVRAEYRKRNAERLREYMRNYFTKRRAEGKKQGLCGNCLKRKRMEGITFCRQCRDNVRRNSEQRRKENEK